MSKKEIRLLIILACINFTNIMDFMIMMPLQEFLSFEVTTQEFSLLVSSYAFTAFISSLTASFLVDRFDRKKTLIFAYSGFIIGTLACGFAPGYTMLVSARIITGMFGGLIGAQVLSMVGDVFPYEKRGRAMGILMSAFALAAVAGMPFGLFIAAKLSWQIPFIGIGVLGLIILPFAIGFIPKMTGHIQNASEKNSFEIYQSIWADRNLQLGLLMMFTLILSHFATIPFIAPFLERNVGFTKEQISLMYFIGGAVSLVGAPLVGKLADRIGKHKVFSIFLLLSCIPVYLLTNMPKVPYYYVLIVTGFFFLFAGGRMVPAQAIITSLVPPHLRGGFMNINSSIMQLATALSAFISGIIVYKNDAQEIMNYQYVGYFGIGVSLICFIVLRNVKAVDKQGVASEQKF